MISADDTPVLGIPTMDADEVPTRPELLGPCPRCKGQGMVFTCIETDAEGVLEHAAASPCDACSDGTRPGCGQLTAAQLARWHALHGG